MSDQPQPADGQCAFFLPKKKRFCRFRPNQGHKYCPEHACVMGVTLERKRIPCPLNPKHTCYEDNLDKHLKKCNSRRRNTADYYEEGVNAGAEEGDCVMKAQTAVKATDTERLRQMIDKVTRLYEEHIGTVEEDIRSHECLRQEMDNPYFGLSALRHRRQQASLIGQLESLGLLAPGHCYVEMGAGKGQLSHWVREAVSSHDDAAFLLVDRSSIRYKVDGYHRDEEQVKFERVKIDIEHLCLGKVPLVANSCRPLVAIGKHLCGAATDLTLRCLMETTRVSSSRLADASTSEPNPKRPRTDESAPDRPIASADVSNTSVTKSADVTNSRVAKSVDANKSSITDSADVTNSGFTDSSDVTNSSTRDSAGVICSGIIGSDDITSSRVADSADVTSSGLTDSNAVTNSSVGKSDISSTDHAMETNSETFSESVNMCGGEGGLAALDKTEGLAGGVRESADPTGSSPHCAAKKECKVKDRADCHMPASEAQCRDVSTNKRVVGVLIALCCHHQCTWRAYVGKPFMRRCGITANDFHLLTRLTSWAVCGWRDRDGSLGTKEKTHATPRTHGNKGDHSSGNQSEEQTSFHRECGGIEEEEGEHDTTDLVNHTNREGGLQLTEKQKEVVGWRCKRLIDYGRVCYLRDQGLGANLKVYIDAQQTPENVVLVATPTDNC